MANIEEITELKAEIDTLKVKITNLEDQNRAKEILLQTRNQLEKDVDTLVKDIKRKDKIIEQLNDKVTAIKSDHIPSEKINIESRVEHEVYDAKEQNVSITLMTSPTKNPPKFKCKYCGKRFSIYTVLEGHIKSYHISMTKYLNTSGQQETS